VAGSVACQAHVDTVADITTYLSARPTNKLRPVADWPEKANSLPEASVEKPLVAQGSRNTSSSPSSLHRSTPVSGYPPVTTSSGENTNPSGIDANEVCSFPSVTSGATGNVTVVTGAAAV